MIIEITKKPIKNDILIHDGKEFKPANKDVLIKELKEENEELKAVIFAIENELKEHKEKTDAMFQETNTLLKQIIQEM